jgi:hypothetical protein
VTADPVDEAAGHLYGLPLEEFIAERDARAKALRKDGDKDAAGEVAKLPKPSQVAWVANQLARAGEAEDLLEAGEALREAQLGGGGREALREATAAERDAVESLLKDAKGLRKLSRDATDRLRTLLHAVAGDEQLRELFEVGRLVAEPEPGGAWPEGAFVAAPRKSAPKKQKEAKPKESAAARRKREAAQRKAAERAKREAQRAREEAERRKLERRLRAARDAADEAKRRLEAAHEAYEDATHEVARIEEQLS